MTHRRLNAAAVALMSATPVAVWWVVGDLDEKGADDRDRMFRPFDLPSVVENVAGVVGVLTAIVAFVILGVGWYRCQLPPWAVQSIAMVCAAGAIVGGGWRLLTASSVGANIGGGMVLVFGYPLAALLLIAAAMNADEPGPEERP